MRRHRARTDGTCGRRPERSGAGLQGGPGRRDFSGVGPASDGPPPAPSQNQMRPLDGDARRGSLDALPTRLPHLGGGFETLESDSRRLIRVRGAKGVCWQGGPRTHDH